MQNYRAGLSALLSYLFDVCYPLSCRTWLSSGPQIYPKNLVGLHSALIFLTTFIIYWLLLPNSALTSESVYLPYRTPCTCVYLLMFTGQRNVDHVLVAWKRWNQANGRGITNPIYWCIHDHILLLSNYNNIVTLFHGRTCSPYLYRCVCSGIIFRKCMSAAMRDLTAPTRATGE